MNAGRACQVDAAMDADLRARPLSDGSSNGRPPCNEGQREEGMAASRAGLASWAERAAARGGDSQIRLRIAV